MCMFYLIVTRVSDFPGNFSPGTISDFPGYQVFVPGSQVLVPGNLCCPGKSVLVPGNLCLSREIPGNK